MKMLPPTRPAAYIARVMGQDDSPRRPSAHRRGYTKAWDRAAKGWLAAHPLCVACEREGRLVSATCVDHIVPHKGEYERFWDSDNWQSLCNSCHSRKTLQEQRDSCPVAVVHSRPPSY